MSVKQLRCYGFRQEQKNLLSYFFDRYIGDVDVGIVHQNLPYDTMHKSLAFPSSFKKIQMQATKMDPSSSSSTFCHRAEDGRAIFCLNDSRPTDNRPPHRPAPPETGWNTRCAWPGGTFLLCLRNIPCIARIRLEIHVNNKWFCTNFLVEPKFSSCT